MYLMLLVSKGKPKNHRKELKYVEKTLPWGQKDLSTAAAPNLLTENDNTEQQKASDVNCRFTADEAYQVEVKDVTDTACKNDLFLSKKQKLLSRAMVLINFLYVSIR